MSKDFIKIPPDILDKNKGGKFMVHVEGWNKATVFLYQWTDSTGLHHIITRKSKKEYVTRNNLLYTRNSSIDVGSK